MIVVHSSALVAIVKGEQERMSFWRRVVEDGAARISAGSFFESAMVCEGGEKSPGRLLFDRELELLGQAGLRIVAFDGPQAELARDAFRRFGKGRHPAALNFGDCFAYALAKALDAPLLYKGDDFAKTDLKRA